MTILRILTGLILTILAVGCPAEDKTVRAPTQVTLRVNTSTALRETLTKLRFKLALREGDVWLSREETDVPREALRWPVDVPVLPRTKDDDSKQFEVVVEALDGETVLAQTRHISQFLPGTHARLELEIQTCPGATGSIRAVCEEPGCVGYDCKVCTASGQCETVKISKPKPVSTDLPDAPNGGSPTDGPCEPDSKICDGDTLRVCRLDGQGYVVEQQCGAGLCDPDAGQCDVCKAGTKSCDGKNVKTCNAEGKRYTSQPCPGLTPVCSGAGVCAQCASASDCGQPSEPCLEATCDDAGKCGTKSRALRTACPGGVCDGLGKCVGCLDDPDCPADKPVCIQGSCTRCRSNSDCGPNSSCDQGQCVDRSFCGNSRVDPELNEECDLFASPDGVNMWNTLNCTEGCKRKVYQNCYGRSEICDLQVLCGAHQVCMYTCSDRPQNGCPPAPGYKTRCDNGFCMLECVTDADCPRDLTCNGGPSATTGGFKWCTARR